ncbi:MAG: hypothetical protein MST01_10745 [Prevotella sp.]|nr:hypothetical protein [Prevotella sp.]
MKKLLVSASFAIFACLGMNAQTVITNNYESPISSLNETKSNDNANSFVKGTDLNLSYNGDSKIAGLSFMSDLNDFLYMGLHFAADVDGFDTYQSIFSLGLSKRYQIGESLLIQGKIGPYAGYGSINKEDKFIYGANANLAVGVKLWETKKGNSTFITVGYYLDAYEFKTTDLFKNGSWGIGFTTVLN